MLYLSLTLIVLLTLTIYAVKFAVRFSFLLVDGESMLPTFKNKQIKFVDRHKNPRLIIDFHKKDVLGKIYTYISPQGEVVVKRLIHIRKEDDYNVFYHFEGDNKDFSFDSRHYGDVEGKYIIGEVIGFKSLVKRLMNF